MPYRYDGRHASVTKPEDWKDFTTVRCAYDSKSKRYSGLGFVLTKADEICVIDLDQCIDEHGVMCDEAKEIVKKMNSFCEISQSGRGVHIFVYGTKPTPRAKVEAKTFKCIEIYDDKRYIAITGNHLEGTPTTIEERQKELDELCAQYFAKPEPKTALAPTHYQPDTRPAPTLPQSKTQLTDDEIISLCRQAKNAAKFEALFDRGDVSLYNGDESSADEALCSILTFYTKDENQIERIFNRSALGERDKWKERPDYRTRTIRNALALVREQYNPQYLNEKYPKQYLNGSNGNAHDELEPDFETELEFLEPPAVQSLLFTPTMRDIYNVLSSLDPPEEYAFVGTLAVCQAIIGDLVAFKKIRVNDYHILIGDSGIGKSSVIDAVQSVLYETHKLCPNAHLTLPNRCTERGLKDVLRKESAKEKEKGITKAPQTAGLLIIDEFASLLEEMRAEHSRGMLSLVLELWDGKPIVSATKGDGTYNIPETAISLLSSITPDMFFSLMPKNSKSNGFFSRLNLVWSAGKESRKSLIDWAVSETSQCEALSVNAEEVLAQRLAQFYHFCSIKPRVIIQPECATVSEPFFLEVDKIAARYSTNSAIVSYAQRLQKRFLKYALLVAVLEAFEGNHNEVVISPHTVKKSAQIVRFFFAHFFNFTLHKSPPTFANDVLGRIKHAVLEKIKEAGREGLSLREISRKVNVAKRHLQNALDELVEAGKLIVQETQGKGRPTQKYILSENLPTKLTKIGNSSENNNLQPPNATDEIPTKYRRNTDESQGESPETNSPCVLEPESPPDATPDAPNTTSAMDATNATDATDVTDTPSTSDQPSDTATASESQPTTARNPEPINAPTDVQTSAPTDAPAPSPEEIVQKVLAELPANQIFTREQIHLAVKKHAPNQVHDVGLLLFPAHILRLADSQKFIFREDAKRPKGYEGLVDFEGVLPDEDPCPF